MRVESLTALGRATQAMRWGGLDASWEYPGFGVLKWPSGRVYVFGTANENITIDVYADDQSVIAGVQPFHTINTGVKSNCENSGQIMTAVLHCVSDLEKHLGV